MAIVVLLGGARSGKSRLAVELAAATKGPVTFIATAEPGDAEIRERIRLHRAERPRGWRTVEEPYALGDVLERVHPQHVVVLDCLSLWVANALAREDQPESIVEAASVAARTAALRAPLTLVVSNEVGLGIVPATPVGRAYRDLLGVVNRVWVSAAEDAFFVVAGRALPLADADVLARRHALGRR
jgi:adenosylcobinamide kinase / adenosylcobinamide-phosphate guanylyltransferase